MIYFMKNNLMFYCNQNKTYLILTGDIVKEVIQLTKIKNFINLVGSKYFKSRPWHASLVILFSLELLYSRFKNTEETIKIVHDKELYVINI